MLAACSEDPVSPSGVPSTTESWFPPLEQGARGYVHPNSDELLQRWVVHLRKGSQQGLRFAQHQLAKSAKSSVLLQAEIELHYEDERDFPYVHNLLQTVALTQDLSAVPLLLKVAKEAKVPVVRTAAVEALADLGAREAVPELFSLIASEAEAGPAGALHHALSNIGGKEVGDWFLQRFRLWLAGDPTMARSGQLAWSGLLGRSDDQAIWRLKSLPLELAKPFYAQALERRAALGDRTVGEELVSLLNAETVPGPGVRSTALEGLVHLGYWEAVVAACSDPDPGVLSTAVQGLRHPAAHEGNWGAAQLEQLRHHPV
ncbi:MAG: HEAT repeat domain-containing protein, partial [Planctomycetes bacterium]|nr:HEAT repeat domain-containing protein [Planctomycetota bacterium]